MEANTSLFTPIRQSPTEHLRVLRQSTHVSRNTSPYLSPGLHNISETWVRYLRAKAHEFVDEFGQVRNQHKLLCKSVSERKYIQNWCHRVKRDAREFVLCIYDDARADRMDKDRKRQKKMDRVDSEERGVEEFSSGPASFLEWNSVDIEEDTEEDNSDPPSFLDWDSEVDDTPEKDEEDTHPETLWSTSSKGSCSTTYNSIFDSDEEYSDGDDFEHIYAYDGPPMPGNGLEKDSSSCGDSAKYADDNNTQRSELEDDNLSQITQSIRNLDTYITPSYDNPFHSHTLSSYEEEPQNPLRSYLSSPVVDTEISAPPPLPPQTGPTLFAPIMNIFPEEEQAMSHMQRLETAQEQLASAWTYWGEPIYSGHPNKCSWVLCRIRNPPPSSSSSSTTTALSSRLPSLQVTTPEGIVCRLYEKESVLPDDHDLHVAERDAAQATMQFEVRLWRYRNETYDEWVRRDKAERWWAERKKAERRLL